MHDGARQIKQLPGAKHMTPFVGRDIQRTFDAMDRDLTRYLVRGQRLSGHEYEAHDLEILGLEKSDRPLVRESRTEGLDVDRLTGTGVRYGHGREYAPGAALSVQNDCDERGVRRPYDPRAPLACGEVREHLDQVFPFASR